MAEHDLDGELDAFLAGHEAELIGFRRDLHAHPETGYHEYRTTRRIAAAPGGGRAAADGAAQGHRADGRHRRTTGRPRR